MPITKSAKKALRQTVRRRKRNIIKTKQIKKTIKDAKKAAAQGKTKEAGEMAGKAYKAIDKAAKTGIIKKNAAARKKSRLMKSIHQILRINLSRPIARSEKP